MANTLAKCNYCTLVELIGEARKAEVTIKYMPISSGALIGWYEISRSDCIHPISYMCGIGKRCSCRQKANV